MLPTMFGSQLAFGLGEEAKNRFSRWLSWQPSWISDPYDFSYFWSTSPRCFLASLESIDLSVQEKKRKIDFQECGHGGYLGFPIGTILAIFDLQVTPMLPSTFGRRTMHDGRRTSTDHNSSPWALRAQVSKKADEKCRLKFGTERVKEPIRPIENTKQRRTWTDYGEYVGWSVSSLSTHVIMYISSCCDTNNDRRGWIKIK